MRARCACDLRVSCDPYLSNALVLRSGKAVDVSRSGVRLVLDQPFAAGTALNIRVRKNSGPTSHLLWANVVWTHRNPESGWHLGCRFNQELSEEEMKELLGA
jgi:PilZ domain